MGAHFHVWVAAAKLDWRECIKEIYYLASIFIDEKLLFTNPKDGLLLFNMKCPIYTM